MLHRVVATIFVAQLDSVTTFLGLVGRFRFFVAGTPLTHAEIGPIEETIRTSLELAAEAVGHLQHILKRGIADGIYHYGAGLRTSLQ